MFSAALSRGLIEAPPAVAKPAATSAFSAALSRGLIEAIASFYSVENASMFSAALSRGLIEATLPIRVRSRARIGFPRL